MTDNARHFVGPATFRALSGHPVVWAMFEEPTTDEIEHVSLAEFAEVVAVVPATANVLGKIAAGVCDDFVTTAVCAADGPVVLAPAMNWRMWENPIVQRNCDLLVSLGYRVVPPESGRLACGEEGTGRLASLATVLAAIVDALNAVPGPDSTLDGRHVLITAGPTREHLDPVRFLSNPASGKMGFALARAARARGAAVTVVSGPTALGVPPGVTVTAVTSAQQMHEAVVRHLPGTDIFIGAAAVANFAPQTAAAEKLPSDAASMTVELVPTAHILGEVAHSEHRPQVVVGFAAETGDVREKASRKLAERGLDLVVANDVMLPGAGFAVDTNEVVIVRRDGSVFELTQRTKDEIAQTVLDEIEQILRSDCSSRLKGDEDIG
jgi:phosphopantothenoylcysteine decarboxylase/phosphopantothenate--cysteine ligase